MCCSGEGGGIGDDGDLQEMDGDDGDGDVQERAKVKAGRETAGEK